MEMDTRKVRTKMRRCAHDNLACSLSPDELRSFFADGNVYYECDSCGMLVRTPAQLRRELGDEWWGGHPSVLAEHKEDCKYTLKIRGESDEQRLKAIIEKVTRENPHLDLDDEVHAMKSKEASEINNSGVKSQLEYLAKAGGIDWLEEYVLADKPDEVSK